MTSLDADVLVEERVVVVPVQATFLFSEISNKPFEVGQRELTLAPRQFRAQARRSGEVDVVVRIFADAVGLF